MDDAAAQPALLCCIFSDDDLVAPDSSASSPRRCDRDLSLCAAHSPPPTPPDMALSCFFTEELGSESTSAAAPLPTSPWRPSNSDASCEHHASCMPATVARVCSSSPAPDCRSATHAASAPSSSHQHAAAPGGRRRSFPPPLPSLLSERPLMRRFRSNGRFVLRRIDNAYRSMFRATRKDGRLSLHLVDSDDAPCEAPYIHPVPACPAPAPLISVPTVVVAKRHSLLRCIPLTPSFKLDLRSTLDSRRAPLSYEALARLMDSQGSLLPLAEEPKPPLSTYSEVASCCLDAGKAVAQKGRQLLALLNLHPVGIGIIILEIGQSNQGRNFVLLHGVYILRGLSLQCYGGKPSGPKYPVSNQWRALVANDCQGE